MNILVSAFVDHNLGDDLMLEILVRRYPHVMFFCLRDASLNALQPYADWPNLVVPDWGDLDRLLPVMDAFLVYGGSAWQDHGDNLRWYDWPTRVIREFRAQGKPILAVGNNIGPLRTAKGQSLFASLLSDFDSVAVRDAFSFDWFQQHVGTGNGVYGADLVFDYPMPAPRRDADLVGISIHRTVQFPERNEPYARNMAAVITRLHDVRPDLRVCLFGFDAITENDRILADEIETRLGHPAYLTARHYEGDIPECLAAFGRCSHVLATRFHALVLALGWGIPFTPFDYMEKAGLLLADLDYRGLVLTHENFERSVETAVDNILHSPCCYDEGRLREVRARASLNFAALDRVVSASTSNAQKRLVLDWLDEPRRLVAVSTPSAGCAGLTVATDPVDPRSDHLTDVLHRYFVLNERGPELVYDRAMGTLQMDGLAAWVDDLLDRTDPHEEDYRIFRAFVDPAEVVLDIGASWGYSAASLWAVGCGCRIVSFEALPQYTDCLARVAALRPGRYDYRMIALGLAPGVVRLVTPVVGDLAMAALSTASRQLDVPSIAGLVMGAARDRFSSEDPAAFTLAETDVAIQSLDHVLAAQDGSSPVGPDTLIAAVKIDVMGLEYEVAVGARDTLRTHKPLVMTAGGNRVPGMSAFMEALGYFYAERDGASLVHVPGIGGAVNGFFVHRDRAESYRGLGILGGPAPQARPY